MKLAATLIDGVCVDCGDNLHEQKTSVRAIMSKYGKGETSVHILYSSQAPAMRKSIAIPKTANPVEVYEAARKEAKKVDADKKKALEKEASAAAERREQKKQARAKRLEKAIPGKKKNKAKK